MNDRSKSRGTATLKWVVAWLISLAAAAFVSVFYFGFPANTGGLSSLGRHIGCRLTERKVYQRHYGNMMDEAAMYCFKASPKEIRSIVQSSGMHEVRDDGEMDWPPVCRLIYWWHPLGRGKGRVFRSTEDDSRTRVLQYDPDTQWVYFVYFET